MKFKLEKKEILYAFFGVMFLLSWFLYIRPLIAPSLNNTFPFVAMVIYNLGTFVGLFFIFSILANLKIKIKATLMSWMFLVGEDIIMAPYIVGTNGVINKGVELWSVSTDGGFASLYQLFLPLNLVWIFTYIVTPTLLMFILPILVSSPKLISKLFH